MSDWTEFEYRNVMGVYQDEEMFGLLADPGQPNISNRKKITIEDYNFTVDWREITNVPSKKNGGRRNKNNGVSVITPVKDQTLRRSCSSSYAFATIAALESLYTLQNPG